MSMEDLSEYRKEAFLEVSGWVAEEAIDALDVASAFHKEIGIGGDALEIGVYKGRFFLALMAALDDGETAVALDIFDNQHLNLDQSGSGDGLRSAFEANIRRFARTPDMLRILETDSMCIAPDVVLAESVSGRFRLISIDGGHTVEHVMNDLWLASQVLAPGAAIFLDDFHSSHWPGVFEGFVRYMACVNRNLAPVLFAGNKLLLTTISHQPAMIAFVRKHFAVHPDKRLADVKAGGFSYIASG